MYRPNQKCPDAELDGVAGEYRDGIEMCPRCGAALVHDPPRWAAASVAGRSSGNGVFSFESFVPVFTTLNRGLIPVIHAVLDGSGIRHFVRHETALHLAEQIVGVEVFVEPEAAERDV